MTSSARRASSVSVSLGKGDKGERLALFSLKTAGSELRRHLSPYGPKHGPGGYLVPLPAAWRTCGAMQKLGVELLAKPGVPEEIRSAAWKCDIDGLFPYQIMGAEFLRSRRRALLADQMGLGKTVCALSAIDEQRGTLVIVPSVILGNWYKEARRWRPELGITTYHPPYGLFPEPGEVRLVTYPQLPSQLIERRSRCPWCGKLSVVPLEDEEVFKLAARQIPWTDKCDSARGGACLNAEGKPGVRSFQQRVDAWPEWVWVGDKPKCDIQLIVDEAHYCKTKDAQRTIATRAIALQCASIWLLTGTPLLNSPPELWSLCGLFPGQGGEFDDGAWDTFGSWSAFVAMFGGRKNPAVNGQSRGYEWKPGYASPEARESLSAIMLRRMRAEVLPDLPVKTRRYIDVPINEKALSKIVTMSENSTLLFKDWSDDQVLAECAVGGALSTIRKELAALKLEMFIKLIKECEQVEEPVIAFSYHRDPIITLGARKGWACITGSTSDRERTALVEKFQRGELRGLAGTIGAMGVGVTLTKSANVMFLDRDFVPANNLQSEDRAVRIGQTRGVIVTILNALHPVDERVSIILERKEALLEAMHLGEEQSAQEGAPL